MPRDLPLGNGKMLLNFDANYHLRDFYYPRVGGENHTSGHPSRFGVWCDGQWGWVHDDDWQRSLDYHDETMVTDVVLRNDRMQLILRCHDAVDFHETVYVRRIDIENLADHPREVRLFFSHDFHISDFDIGDTAYYHPGLNVIIHYKGPRYFLCNALTEDGRGISDFATGVSEVEGKEGTWRDAEGDGILGKNPIAQGSVDSTIGINFTLEPNASTYCHYYICVAESYQDVTRLNDVVIDKKPQTFVDRTAAYWNLWVNKDEYEFDDLPPEVVHLYKRSLLILRTQMDNGGAILAANDTDNTHFNRDTYSYMWPRDGALVAHALSLSGFSTLVDDFFAFCAPLITREGYFLHKYNPDGSAGSSWHPWEQAGERQLPIQEDETSLILWALWKHFDKFRNVEDIKPLYRDLIIRAGDFLSSYLSPTNDLPLPSYDLWEERRGIHAWTVGATYGGLISAANFARAFGEMETAQRYEETAAQIKRGAEAHLWRPEAERFVRMLNYSHDGTQMIDWTLDASILGLVFFGMYAPNDAKIIPTVEKLRERLWVKTDVGGMARYENDYYHQVSQDIGNVAGNPWFICTLWLAQYEIACAKTAEDLTKAIPILQWVTKHALPSGVLAEQVDPYTHAPLSVSPLTWSHAAFVTTCIEYLDKKSELSICEECGQPLFTKENEKLHRDRAHKEIHRTIEQLNTVLTDAANPV